jgi:hypothetical protein
VDPDYGKRVAEGLGLELNEIQRLAAISGGTISIKPPVGSPPG